MSHVRLLRRDAGHPDARELVAVTAALPKIIPALEFEDAELLSAPVIDYLGGERRTGEERLADGDLVSVRNQHHTVELQLVARLALEAGHVERLVRRHLGLDAVDLDDGVHLASISLGGWY